MQMSAAISMSNSRPGQAPLNLGRRRGTPDNPTTGPNISLSTSRALAASNWGIVAFFRIPWRYHIVSLLGPMFLLCENATLEI